MLPRATLAVLAGAAATADAIGSPELLTPVVYRRAAIGAMPLPSALPSAYRPEISHCGSGNSCAEVCGAGYDQCGVSADVAHCFNPGAGKTCCSGASGIACNKGYCTTDASNTNHCCPDGEDLETCAKNLKVSGPLQSAVSSQAPSTTSTTTTAYTPTSSSPAYTTSATTLVLPTTTLNSTTTTLPPPSSLAANTTPYSLPAPIGLNATATGLTSFIPSGSPVAALVSATTQAPSATPISAAAAQGISALLLVAAAAVALL